MLVVRPTGRPSLIVPMLERPLAAGAPGGRRARARRVADADDPYAIVAAVRRRDATVAIGRPDVGLARACAAARRSPGAAWTSAATGGGRAASRKDEWRWRRSPPPRRPPTQRSPICGRGRFAGRTRARRRGRTSPACSSPTATSEPSSRSWAPARTRPRRTTSRPTGRSRPGDAVVLDFGGGSTGTTATRRGRSRWGSPRQSSRTSTRSCGARRPRAVEAVRPGVEIEPSGPRRAAVIDEAGFGERFIHRTGHGIGLEVHEPPYAAAGDHTRARARA